MNNKGKSRKRVAEEKDAKVLRDEDLTSQPVKDDQNPEKASWKDEGLQNLEKNVSEEASDSEKLAKSQVKRFKKNQKQPEGTGDVFNKEDGKSKKSKKPNKVKSDEDTSLSEDTDFEKGKSTAKGAPKSKFAQETGSSGKIKGPKLPNRSILQLKITLLDITPPIWRRIQVLNNDTFFNLHSHINEAMGWISAASHHFIVPNPNPKTNSNIMIVNGSIEGLYDFSKDRHTLKAQSTKLSRFLTAKADRILYEFSSDSWMHEIVVEKILPPPPPKAEFPKCTGGKRNCPPEDCGGVDGYEHLLEVYKNPNHEKYEELITDWLGENSPGWDPEKFDRKKIFKRVWMWVQRK